MSQRAMLAALDQDLHTAFAGAGMADVGVYTPTGEGAQPVVGVQAYVDRDVQTLGDTRQYRAGRVEVAYVMAPGFVPERHGRFAVDGDTYVNDVELSNDGSLSRWVVTRG